MYSSSIIKKIARWNLIGQSVLGFHLSLVEYRFGVFLPIEVIVSLDTESSLPVCFVLPSLIGGNKLVSSNKKEK